MGPAEGSSKMANTRAIVDESKGPPSVDTSHAKATLKPSSDMLYPSQVSGTSVFVDASQRWQERLSLCLHRQAATALSSGEQPLLRGYSLPLLYMLFGVEFLVLT